MHIFIHRDGQQFGPYPVELAREYLASGNLLPGDLAWHEGMTDWLPLGQLPMLAAPVAAQRDWIPPRREANAADVPSDTVHGSDAVNLSGGGKRVRRTRGSAMKNLDRKGRMAGAKNMGLGALFFVGGIVATVVSFQSAASNPHGGTYIVAWGAVIFGGIRFVTGLVQFCKG